VTPEQRRRVRELYLEAVDHSPARLQQWLAERIDDAAVLEEVVSLLKRRARPGPSRPDAAPRSPGTPEPGLPPGQRVGPYEIVAEAGRGGMGRVYRAWDTRLQRTVALKSLAGRSAADPSRRKRLRREARAAAGLSHPGICTVYALEETNGDLFLVTEFLEGATLREEIACGPRPSSLDVVRTAHELASALGSAHAAGVTHRDLKPENVMRSRDGRIKIFDFGLARIERPVGVGASPISLVTEQGTIIGTPAYMAPEQLLGQPADARSDVFAFRVLMYEYACGEHPFRAATPVVRLGRVLEATPEPLERRRPDLPRSVTAVIGRCLRKAPEERFADAAEILRRLDEASDASSSALAPDARPTPLDLRWWRVHQVVVIGLYAVAGLFAWLVKQWRAWSWWPGLTVDVFIGIGIVAAIAALLRAHLLFTERVRRQALPSQRKRLEPITLVLDLVSAVGIAADGLAIVASRAVAGVLIAAFGAGVALARLVLEPATTEAAFGALRRGSDRIDQGSPAARR
jgi:serine/threonine protein kinase